MRGNETQRELLETNIVRSQTEVGELDHCVVTLGIEDVMKDFTGGCASLALGFSTPC